MQQLQEASAEFRQMWPRQEVARRRTTRKVVLHPQVGRLDPECDVVVNPESGQRLVLLRPAPGTGTDERLELLSVVGTQQLNTT